MRDWLCGLRLPSSLAALLTLVAIVSAVSGFGALVGDSASRYLEQMPSHEARAAELTEQGIDWLESHRVPAARGLLPGLLDPGAVPRFAGEILNALAELRSRAFLMLLAVAFLLFEAEALSVRLRTVARTNAPDPSGGERRVREVSRYLAIHGFTGLVFGSAVMMFLAIAGVSLPILWGVAAFLLNYAAGLGRVLAAAPVVLLAASEVGVGQALIVALGYGALGVALVTVIERRLTERSFELSMPVVFLSLVFWGWVFGPVGVLLAAPLTVIVKTVLLHTEDARWLAALLGPVAPGEAPVGARVEFEPAKAAMAAEPLAEWLAESSGELPAEPDVEPAAEPSTPAPAPLPSLEPEAPQASPEPRVPPPAPPVAEKPIPRAPSPPEPQLEKPKPRVPAPAVAAPRPASPAPSPGPAARASRLPEQIGLPPAPLVVAPVHHPPEAARTGDTPAVSAVNVVGAVMEYKVSQEIAARFRRRRNLRNNPFPDVVQELGRARLSAELIVRRDDVLKTVLVREGKLVFAQSSDPNDRLGDVLLVRGEITLDQYLDAQRGLHKGRRAGSVLVEIGAIQPAQLGEVVVAQTRATICRLFTWTEGEYWVADTPEGDCEPISLKSSTPDVLMDGIARIDAWSQIEHGIGGADAPYRRSRDFESRIAQMKLSAGQRALLDQLDHSHRVEDLCEASALASIDVCRTLWALKVIGAVEAGEHDFAPLPLPEMRSQDPDTTDPGRELPSLPVDGQPRPAQLDQPRPSGDGPTSEEPSAPGRQSLRDQDFPTP